MEPLEIVPSEHVSHIREKFAGLKAEELASKKKEMAANKKHRYSYPGTIYLVHCGGGDLPGDHPAQSVHSQTH